MKCIKAERLISEYIDGELDARSAAALQDHLKGCSGCRQVYEDLKGIAQEAGELQPLEPRDRVWPRIRSAWAAGRREAFDVREARGEKRGFLFPWMKAPLAWASAAAVLVVAVVGLAIWRPWQSASPLGPESVDAFTQAKLAEARDYYEKAVQALSEAVRAQAGEVDPLMAAAFRKNLEVVDSSIRLCSEIVQKSPDDLETYNKLLAAYRNKMTILTDLAAVKRHAETGRTAQAAL